MVLKVGRITPSGKVLEVKPLTRKQAQVAVRRQWRAIRCELPKDSYWRDTVRLLRHTALRDGQYIAGFMDAVGCGFYPPPEVLFAVHDAFDAYLAADGKLSLEEAFFGKPTVVQRAPGHHLLVHGALLRGQDRRLRRRGGRRYRMDRRDSGRVDGSGSGAVGRCVELLVPRSRVRAGEAVTASPCRRRPSCSPSYLQTALAATLRHCPVLATEPGGTAQGRGGAAVMTPEPVREGCPSGGASGKINP